MIPITLIPGDGIGPEITEAVVTILRAAGAPLSFDVQEAGAAVHARTGTLIPDALFESLERTRVALKGPLTTPIGSGFRSLNVTLRKKYDLFANVRPVKNLGRVPTRFQGVDLVIFRENTEDLYAGIEKAISPDEMHSIKVITRSASTRIAEEAFAFARKHQLSKVTVVTKANIMKLTDGLFLETARRVAQDYPDILLEEILVDNMAMQLVLFPERTQVILTENLYGDILSDLCAGLVGGLGMVPGANLGKDMAIFEAVHGSAPDIAGKNLANPTALLLSACLLLDHLGEAGCAQRIRQALHRTLSHPDGFTRDLGGSLTTTAFTEKILETLSKEETPC